MAIRLSGMVSNMDTEAIIKEMMSVQNLKKTKIENKVTKLDWEQDKWKELNSKIYALYTESLSKFKTQSSYLTKSVTSSDSSKASFEASSLVPAGTHKVEISSLASSQFVTGDKVSKPIGADGKEIEISKNTKLSELGVENGTIYTIKTGAGKVSNFTISSDTTIKDFNNFCKEAGVNASYDTTQNRFFLSSMSSGKEHSFELTSSVVPADNGTNTDQMTIEKMEELKSIVAYDLRTEDQKIAIDNAIYTMASTTDDTEYNNAVQTLNNYAVAHETAVKEVEQEVYATDAYGKNVISNFKEAYTGTFEESMLVKGSDGTYTLDPAHDTPENRELLANASQKALYSGLGKTNYATEFSNELKNNEAATTPVTNDKITNAVSGLTARGTLTSSDQLSKLGIGQLVKEVNASGEETIVSQYTGANPVTLVQGSDCKLMYNDAEFTSSSNSITINGLTINATGVTEAGKPLMVTVSNDTTAVYDMVKGFVKQYNEVLKEMNTAYYADSARGYDVLTDEEKDQMTEEQIEKWENKIKDSLLRRDDTLYSVMSAVKRITSFSVDVDGKSYTLGDFGIGTSSNYKEKGLLHINGDIEDSSVSILTNKLQEAINNDPDLVMEVLTGVGNELYSTLNDKMKSTSLSSALTFYNDKQLAKTKTNYGEQIKKMETKLKSMEDRYYKKFTAMEVALSKLNSQTSYFSSMLGPS